MTDVFASGGQTKRFRDRPSISRPRRPFWPERVAGVWVTCSGDTDRVVDAVYADEVQALREINSRGYGRVVFIPYGVPVDDVHSGRWKQEKQ